MTVELSRRLLASGVPSADIEAALFLSVARGIPMARALVDRGVVSERSLEDELARWGGIALRQVNASTELWVRLPMSMCRRLGAVPLRLDAATGTVEVAAIDPLDHHVASEFAFHLGMPVRVQRATLSAIEEAVRRLELGENEGAATSRSRRRTPAFPHGAPKSSVPPPPVDDVPIPLVRRVSLPAVADEGEDLALVTPRPSRAIATDAHQRAVSFPSTPPPAGPPGAPQVVVPTAPPAARGSTPTFGVPVLAPRRTHTPALGSMVVTPTRGSPTPPLGTFPAVATPAPVAAPRFDPSPHEQRDNQEERGRAEERVRLEERERNDEVGAPLPMPQRAPEGMSHGEVPGWATPSETLEAGFRRASGEFTLALRASAPPPQMIDATADAAPPSDDDGSEELTQVKARGRELSMSLEEALDRLGDAQGRDGVVEAALGAMGVIAPRVALFVARRDAYQGWSCSPEFGDQAALRNVVMPHKTPSILATAAAAGFYLGPVPSTPGHAGLLSVMKHVGPDVAVSVVRVAGKPALVLIAEGLDDSMRGTKALGEIARVAGYALSRVLSSR